VCYLNELEQNRCLCKIHIVLKDTEIKIAPNMDPAKLKSFGNLAAAFASLSPPPPPTNFVNRNVSSYVPITAISDRGCEYPLTADIYIRKEQQE
jgi:hypothetical protein